MYATRFTWLICYYDGNENKFELLPDADHNDIATIRLDLEMAGQSLMFAVQLAPDQVDSNIVPAYKFVDDMGGIASIADLPVYDAGEES